MSVDHIENVRAKAKDLATALGEATESGISPALILPELIDVFRESGVIPADMLPA